MELEEPTPLERGAFIATDMMKLVVGGGKVEGSFKVETVR